MSHMPYESIIEGILFAMGDALPPAQIAHAIHLSEEETIGILLHMQEMYEREERGMRLICLDGSWQMCTAKETYEYLIRIAKQPKKYALTDVLMETLSIIAYKQPITKAEVEKIRGVSSDHAVNRLVEYQLVEEVGRLDAPGRPMLFGTSEEFLRSFGVHSIDELPSPSPEQIEEMRLDVQRQVDQELVRVDT